MGKYNTADQYWVRDNNLSVVIKTIWENHQPISRSALTKLSGMNKTTIGNLLEQLKEWGFIEEIGPDVLKSAGRPGVLLDIDNHSNTIIGVEIRINKIVTILSDFKGKILWRTEISFVDQEPELVFRQAKETVREAVEENNKLKTRLLGIGISILAMVDRNANVVSTLLSFNQPSFNPSLEWQKEFGVPVLITNDGKAAAIGELVFSNRLALNDDFVYVVVGDGLGGGIVTKGSLYGGYSGLAGEIGHITIDPNGNECICGNYGCWETYVCLRAVNQAWLASSPENQSLSLTRNNLQEIFDALLLAASKGERAALEALETAGKWLGIGIASLINTFNPKYVIIGGEFSVASKYFIDSVEKEVSRRALKHLKQDVEIIISSNQENAIVLGAVALVVQSVLKKPSIFKPLTQTNYEVLSIY
jgi:predicted NBD/HSP70 family sugar kinase